MTPEHALRIISTQRIGKTPEELDEAMCVLVELVASQSHSNESTTEGLEEEISRTYHDGSVTDTDDIDHVAYENIARHFAEWGAEHLKR